MKPIAIAALFMLATPAFAEPGFRATYHGETEPKVLEVEATDAGNYRIGKPGDPAYGLEIGGRYYLVAPGPGGAPEAMAVEDVAAVVGEALPPIFAQLFSEGARAQPAPPVKMEPAGTRTVAGFPGEVWKVTLGNNPPETQEMVFSADPALKPVGRAIGRFLESMMVMMAPMMGDMAGEMIGEMRTVFAKGTPLESQGRFKLVSAGAADIPAGRVALPGKPLSRDEIRKRVVAKPLP
jgi:hypothetical protein